MVPNDYNYTQIMLGSQKVLSFTAEALNNNIFIDFKLSEGQICIDPSQKNIINGEPYF